MTSDQDLLPAWLTGIDTRRAAADVTWLIDNLAAPCFALTDELISELKKNREFHGAILQRNFAVCKAVEHFGGISFLVGEEFSGDPGMISNAASMLNVMLQGYDREHAPEDTLEAIDRAHAATLEKFLTTCSDQIEALCGYLQRIRQFIDRLSIDGSRIVLLDFPVGNSLPVAMLQSLLQERYRPDVLRISLSRNDAGTKGITREDLLWKKLETFGPSKNDIVIYLDEWNTGANFKTISQLVSGLLPPESFLFCAAILTSEARLAPRYETFCQAHDAIMRRWGSDGSEFRAILPPIPSKLVPNGYFFWSENDRMSGFRKMQIHGSIFSTFDEAIEMLRMNGSALRKAIEFQVAEIAREREVPNGGVGLGGLFQKKFFEAYEAYQKCRGDFRKCADDLADGGEMEADEALSQVLARYAKVDGSKDAKLAFLLAHAYLKRFGSLDPADRYHFKEHAPTLIRLKGRAGRTHEIAMRYLRERCGQI